MGKHIPVFFLLIFSDKKGITRMSLEGIMLCKNQPVKKDKYCLTPLTGGPWRSQIHSLKAGWWVPEAGVGGWGFVFNGDSSIVGRLEEFWM